MNLKILYAVYIIISGAMLPLGIIFILRGDPTKVNNMDMVFGWINLLILFNVMKNVGVIKNV